MATSIEEGNRPNNGLQVIEGTGPSTWTALQVRLPTITDLLTAEDREEYLTHNVAMIADLRPDGPLQDALAQYISDGSWRLRRFRVIGTTQLARRAQPGERTPGDSIEKLGRVEKRLGSQIRRALKTLKALQREAHRLAKKKLVLVPAPSGFVPHLPRPVAADRNGLQIQPAPRPPQ